MAQRHLTQNKLTQPLYLYRKAFQESDMGYASALAWVLFIIIAALSFFVLRSSNRWVYYEGSS